MRSEPMIERPGRASELDILASAVVRADADQLGRLRASPGPRFGELPSGNALKLADEQTVAGLSAVLHAIAHSGFDWRPGSFHDWGVLAAPQFLGRSTFLSAFERFSAEGAWGVSPHIVPHRSLHSVSGMISLVLQAHGPNFGVGGGPLAADEAFLAVAAIGSGEHGATTPLWLVLTQPAPHGRPGQCHAIAMALSASQPGSPYPRLRVRPSRSTWSASSALAHPCFQLETFGEVLESPTSAGAEMAWRLACGGWLEYCFRGDSRKPADTEERVRPSRSSAQLAEVGT